MGNREHLLIFMLALILITTLTGCTSALIAPAATQPTEQIKAPEPPATEEASDLLAPQPTNTPLIDSPDIAAPKPSQTLASRLEPIEPPDLQPVVGEVPEELLEEILADLVQRTGAARQDIEVIRAEAVVWNDGSLGCPKPGEFYIQILINGYWVILEVEGVYYDYRVSDSGHFILCEGKGMPLITTPDTGGQTQNPLVFQAKEDLAERLGIQITEIELLKIEEVTWRDSSLGCPQPGMVYAQVLVDGSLIQLKHKDNVYQYHSGKGGRPFLCENPAPGFEGVIYTGEELTPPPELSDK